MVVVFLMILTFSIGSLLAQAGADKIVGKWLNEDKDAKVEITKKGDKFYGKIVWLLNPTNDAGNPKVDDKNPEVSLQSRPILGLEILKDFVFDEDEWEDGEIYDPKSGKTYSCYMEFESPTVLKIKGYIGVKWVGKTTYWTKAE